MVPSSLCNLFSDFSSKYVTYPKSNFYKPIVNYKSIYTTRIRFIGIKVHNGNLVPIVVPKTNYEITANGIQIAKGSTESKYTIAGNSDKTIDANTLIKNSMLDE